MTICLATASHAAALGGGELHQRLRSLSTAGTVLYVAAHPDDENTALLSWLVRERGLRVVYLSITRGDGGQNRIGAEQSELFGVIRTQELLAARQIDGAEQRFTRARDFGYSKGPDETLRIWGRDEILSDVVRVIRTVQPDVIFTRFAAKGRNHGHHTASAILAIEGFAAAADPARFPEQGLPAWKTSRILRNVSHWRLPKDADTSKYLKLQIGGYNTLLGRSYAELSAASRSMHKSQGFGVSPKRGWRRELFEPIAGSPAQGDPLSGLDLTLARYPGTAALRGALADATKAFDPVAPQRALPALLRAADALARLPSTPFLKYRARQLRRVIAGCSGLWLDATLGSAFGAPGEALTVTTHALARLPVPIRLERIEVTHAPPWDKPASLEHGVPLEVTRRAVLPDDEPLGSPRWVRERPDGGRYRVADPTLIGLPEGPAALTARVRWSLEGRVFEEDLPVVHRWTDPVHGARWRRFVVVPSATVTIAARALMFAGDKARPVAVRVRAGRDAAGGEVSLRVADGWKVAPASRAIALTKRGEEQVVRFTVTPPAGGATAVITPVFRTQGREAAFRITEIDYPHIPVQSVVQPAAIPAVAVDLRVANRRLGYISGAGDEVAESLRAVGYDVTILGEEDITPASLKRFDAILIGVRAFNTRPWLWARQATLLSWTAGGGTLIAQYNTNSRWSKLAGNIGPKPLTIGRGRVTDETATMTAIDPKHPALNRPNRLGPADFAGWVQERGLYFAKRWDSGCSPIFSLADPGATPQRGGLLVCGHGKGTFVYTGLAFFRQLPAGVPGAYRLLANLIAL